MTGATLTTTQLLSYLAAFECFLAGLIVFALCFLHSSRADKESNPAIGERWWFVFALRAAGQGAFLFASFMNYSNQIFHKGSNVFLAGAAIAALALFVGAEAFAARRAVRIAIDRGGRILLSISAALHVVLMCVLAHAALFAWSAFPQAGVPYFKMVLKWDPLYVLMCVFVSLLISAVLCSHVKNRLRLRPLEYIAGGFSSFIVCAYVLLVPLQARYLVLMTPVSDDGSLDFNLEYFASEARVEALRRLVPWMSYKPLDGLKTAWWDAVTVNVETPNDPVYLEQLRRAARAGQRSSLERLWVKFPGEARGIAEQLLSEAESPKNVRHFLLGEGPAVLFLEDPDRELFKDLIPDDKRRGELHRLLWRWTNSEEKKLLERQPYIAKTTTCHLLSEAYYNLQNKLFDPAKPQWLAYDGEEIPESLQPAAVDFITFTDIRRGYQLLGCPGARIAMLAIQDIIDSAHRRNRLVVDPWNRAAGIDMEELLGNIHLDVAIPCMRELVEECGEAPVLTGWAFTANRPCPELVKHSDFILAHWDEIVPRAKKKMDGSGIPAQTAFVTGRLSEL